MTGIDEDGLSRGDECQVFYLGGEGRDGGRYGVKE